MQIPEDPRDKPESGKSFGAGDAGVEALVSAYGCDHSSELIEEMIMTALRMGRDRLSVADLKMINRALKELRAAARVFSPYNAFRKIAVFGSARTDPGAPEYEAAVEFSRRMVEAGYMVITGGGDGIMGAAQKGAGREHSFGLNINLPFEQRANETIEGDPKLVNFNYFFTRKVNFVKETHAIALFPGGFGTMDEGFECLTLMQTGKAKIIPLIVVDAPGGGYWSAWDRFLRDHLLGNGLISPDDFHFYKYTTEIEEAIEEVQKFYRVFHSYRYVGDQMVIRLNHSLEKSALDRLNKNFSDLLAAGDFRLGTAMRAERNEPELADLPRLIFEPHRRNFGRMREMIDFLNQQ